MGTTPRNKLYDITFAVRWSDMDAMGHVNNAVYFRYFEIARLAWYDSLGNAALGSTNTGMVIVDAHCEYLKPLVYPASITVSLYGGAPGRSSFNSFYEITNTASNELCTRGSARMVWINIAQNKSTPLPDAVVGMLPT